MTAGGVVCTGHGGASGWASAWALHLPDPSAADAWTGTWPSSLLQALWPHCPGVATWKPSVLAPACFYPT